MNTIVHNVWPNQFDFLLLIVLIIFLLPPDLKPPNYSFFFAIKFPTFSSITIFQIFLNISLISQFLAAHVSEPHNTLTPCRSLTVITGICFKGIVYKVYFFCSNYQSVNLTVISLSRAEYTMNILLLYAGKTCNNLATPYKRDSTEPICSSY